MKAVRQRGNESELDMHTFACGQLGENKRVKRPALGASDQGTIDGIGCTSVCVVKKKQVTRGRGLLVVVRG